MRLKRQRDHSYLGSVGSIFAPSSFFNPWFPRFQSDLFWFVFLVLLPASSTSKASGTTTPEKRTRERDTHAHQEMVHEVVVASSSSALVSLELLLLLLLVLFFLRRRLLLWRCLPRKTSTSKVDPIQEDVEVRGGGGRRRGDYQTTTATTIPVTTARLPTHHPLNLPSEAYQPAINFASQFHQNSRDNYHPQWSQLYPRYSCQIGVAAVFSFSGTHPLRVPFGTLHATTYKLERAREGKKERPSAFPPSFGGLADSMENTRERTNVWTGSRLLAGRVSQQLQP